MVWYFFAVCLMCCCMYVLQKNVYKSAPQYLSSMRLSLMDKEVQYACKYIEKNYSNPDLSVGTICTALITGDAFLEALFEKELGMSVSEYIARVRISHAKQKLLEMSTLPFDFFSRQLGFTDGYVFQKAFLAISGVSFVEYASSFLIKHE